LELNQEVKMENKEYQNRDDENEEENTEELITVFSTDDYGTAMIVKQMLEEAGIEYDIKYEGDIALNDVWGLTGGGYSPFSRPVDFQVLEENSEKAIELLKDVEKSKPIADPGSPNDNINSEKINGDDIIGK
jgi:hypothetical protein